MFIVLGAFSNFSQPKKKNDWHFCLNNPTKRRKKMAEQVNEWEQTNEQMNKRMPCDAMSHSSRETINFLTLFCVSEYIYGFFFFHFRFGVFCVCLIWVYILAWEHPKGNYGFLAFLGYFNDVHAVDTYTHKTEIQKKKKRRKKEVIELCDRISAFRFAFMTTAINIINVKFIAPK